MCHLLLLLLLLLTVGMVESQVNYILYISYSPSALPSSGLNCTLGVIRACNTTAQAWNAFRSLKRIHTMDTATMIFAPANYSMCQSWNLTSNSIRILKLQGQSNLNTEINCDSDIMIRALWPKTLAISLFSLSLSNLTIRTRSFFKVNDYDSSSWGRSQNISLDVYNCQVFGKQENIYEGEFFSLYIFNDNALLTIEKSRFNNFLLYIIFGHLLTDQSSISIF